MSASPNWEFQSILIDFDVFKALTAERESASDSFNDVLRRKLGLAARPSVLEGVVRGTTDDKVSGRPWICDEVEFPDGTKFRAHYKRRQYLAAVEDGALIYEKKKYFSPSAAAIAVTGSNVNGWRFWECQLPGEDRWGKIDLLRSNSQGG